MEQDVARLERDALDVSGERRGQSLRAAPGRMPAFASASPGAESSAFAALQPLVQVGLELSDPFGLVHTAR